MRILVTGCAGFIGSHTVEALLNMGHQVVGVDCFSYAGKEENMVDFINSIEFYRLNICQTQKILDIVDRHSIECILNFAAETHVDNSIQSCDEFIRSNIEGVKSLLDVCRDTGCLLFHVSTDEVYGSTDSGSFDETDSLNPKNPYAATKASAELLIKSYENTYKTKNIMIRMSNNYGPRQDREKLLPTVIRSLISGKKVPIYGDGTNIRDWLYVKDAAIMISRLVQNQRMLHGEILNITNSQEMQNIEIIQMVCDIMEKDFEKNVTYVTDRPGHDFRYSISNKKLKQFIDLPKTDLEDSLKNTIEFYRKQK